MYPNVSDDILIKLNRRHNKTAFDLLYMRYSSFIARWIGEKEWIKNSDYEYLFNGAMLEFLKCIDNYDETKGLFYSYAEVIIDRYIKREEEKYRKYYDHISYYNTEDNDYLILKEDESVINSSVRVGTKIDTRISRMLNELEEQIIDYKLNGYSYKLIAATLNVDIKKIDNTIQKYNKLKRDLGK